MQQHLHECDGRVVQAVKWVLIARSLLASVFCHCVALLLHFVTQLIMPSDHRGGLCLHKYITKHLSAHHSPRPCPIYYRHVHSSPPTPFPDLPGHSITFLFVLFSSKSTTQFHSPLCPLWHTSPLSILFSSIPISPHNSLLLPMFHCYPFSVLSHVLLFPVFCFYPPFAISGRLASQNSFTLLAHFDLQPITICSLIISSYTPILFRYKNPYYSIARPQFVID